MHPKQPQSISTTTPVYQRRICSAFCKFEKPTAQTKLRGKSKEGGRSPLLGRFKGIAKGEIEIPLCRFLFTASGFFFAVQRKRG